MGLIAHTCLEATVRYAAELGYEVTVVKDATASFSEKHMHALSKSISQTTPVPL
jgi:ureidoacrylate peracid hydrolase